MARYPSPRQKQNKTKQNTSNWIWAQMYILLLGLKQELLRLATSLSAC